MDDVEVAEFACDRVNAPTQVALERGGIKDGEGVKEQKGRIDAQTSRCTNWQAHMKEESRE